MRIEYLDDCKHTHTQIFIHKKNIKVEIILLTYIYILLIT